MKTYLEENDSDSSLTDLSSSDLSLPLQSSPATAATASRKTTSKIPSAPSTPSLPSQKSRSSARTLRPIKKNVACKTVKLKAVPERPSPEATSESSAVVKRASVNHQPPHSSSHLGTSTSHSTTPAPTLQKNIMPQQPSKTTESSFLNKALVKDLTPQASLRLDTSTSQTATPVPTLPETIMHKKPSKTLPEKTSKSSNVFKKALAKDPTPASSHTGASTPRSSMSNPTLLKFKTTLSTNKSTVNALPPHGSSHLDTAHQPNQASPHEETSSSFHTGTNPITSGTKGTNPITSHTATPTRRKSAEAGK
ncbi:hypothetical protein PGTUg99_035343 [Puccinia graminis f. sp. tritici]|uniref:Uncharacterized protein n=1 Tax=Puccinia graminis f. sp. tritici TaxID=56615 RepID=A0A5B0QA07_PUCGR|nr:hypothetical protein PGTUg99_035343 [Puccinia graminis f. sp. tritici]